MVTCQILYSLVFVKDTQSNMRILSKYVLYCYKLSCTKEKRILALSANYNKNILNRKKLAVVKSVVFIFKLMA